MASIIKIKRKSNAAGAPSSLQEGEIAVNLFSRKLYVGNSTGVTAVGGEDFAITSQAPTAGAGAYIKVNGETSSNSVLLNAGTDLDIARQANGSILFELEDTISSNTTGNAGTATALATARTIGGVSFDGTSNINLPGVNATGNQDTTGSAATLTTPRSIGLGGDLSGSANFDGSQNITITATIGADSVALGTDTTGNYVETLAAGNNSIVITGADSEGATKTVSLGDNIGANTSGTAATATALATARTIGGVSFDGTANINLPGVNATGNQDTSGNAGTATALETARTIGGVSFDGTANINLPGVNTTGNQDTTGNAATATALETARTIAGQSFDGTGNITIAATDLSDTDQALATTSNVTHANITATGDLAVSGNATIDGNLTVEGAVTYISSSTVNVDDSMLKLSANNAGDTVDTGVYGKYVVSGNSAVQYAGYFRDAGDGTFKFYTGLDVEPTTTVDTTDTGYGLAQVDAIIDGGTY